MIDISKLTTEYIEPHLAERIQKAKDYASLIKNGHNLKKFEDVEMALRYVVSKHYKIPIFHKYFSDLTIDQLFFEVELIISEYKTHSENVSDTIKENNKEIESLANEMESEWSDMAMDESLESDPVFQMAKEFMKTGQFLNEKTTTFHDPEYSKINNNNNTEEMEDEDHGNWK